MFLQNVDTLIAFSLIMLLLSTLVTVLVQMGVSIFGLRGRNLFWGVRKLVGSIAPDLSLVDAEELAKKILSHSSLAVTREAPFFRKYGKTRPPVTIEPKEVLLVLDTLLRSGELSDKVKETVKGLFERDAGDASRIVQSLDFLDSLEQAAPEQAAVLREVAERGLGEVKQIAVGIHDWFDGAMQRASERFTLHTRWWTTGVGVVLAFGLGVDSIYILKQLQENPRVATQIALKSDRLLTMVADFERIQANEEQTQKAAKAASEAASAQPKEVPDAEATETSRAQEEQSGDCEAAEAAAQKAAEVADQAREAAENAESEQGELRNQLAAQAENYEKLRKELLGLDLKIFTNLPGQEPNDLDLKIFTEVPGEETKKLSLTALTVRFLGVGPGAGARFFGLVMTALLLGLGGPFWYGLIGKLVGFRSLVASTKKERARPNQ